MKNENSKNAPKVKMTEGEYRDKLHKYSNRFLTCKDLRHVWTVQRAYTEHQNSGMVSRILVCKRCGTERTDYFRLDQATERMERGYSSYRYPTGFQMAGIPRDSKPNDIIRYEAFLRFVAGPQEKK
jgi:hypothetical protein